jgi:hypothetical protein
MTRGLPPPDLCSLCPQLNLLNPHPEKKFLSTPLHGGISSNDLTLLRKKIPEGGKHSLKVCTELDKTICTFSKKNYNRPAFKIKIHKHPCSTCRSVTCKMLLGVWQISPENSSIQHDRMLNKIILGFLVQWVMWLCWHQDMLNLWWIREIYNVSCSTEVNVNWGGGLLSFWVRYVLVKNTHIT